MPWAAARIDHEKSEQETRFRLDRLRRLISPTHMKALERPVNPVSNALLYRPKQEIQMQLDQILQFLKLPQDMTRRGFIRATSVTAAIALMNEARAKEGARPYIVFETAKGLIIGDPNLCVTCQRCELACTEFNEGKSDPKLARIKIGRNYWFGPDATTSLPAFSGAMGLTGTVQQDCCRQCPHPTPCANACPHGAIRVDEKTGARFVDQERCIGCRLCQKACPWEMMTFDEEAKKASKCFLCHGSPKCVKACPAQALRYVEWFDRTHEHGRHPEHGYLPKENAAQCSICHS